MRKMLLLGLISFFIIVLMSIGFTGCATTEEMDEPAAEKMEEKPMEEEAVEETAAEESMEEEAPADQGFFLVEIEAETGEIEAPLQTGTDEMASGGEYVYSEVRDEGTVSLEFTVPEDGEYLVWTRILAPASSDDSWFVWVDDGDEDVFDAAEKKWSPEYQWSVLNGRAGGKPLSDNPRTLELSAGEHTIYFRSRDTFSILDKIIITDNLKYSPPGAPAPGAFLAKIEAEAGQIEDPLKLGSDEEASGGYYVYSDVRDEGIVSFSVTALEAGNYVVWTRILAPESGADSWFVWVDEGDEDVFDAAEKKWSPEYQWSVVNGRGGGAPLTENPRIFEMEAGGHMIHFRSREEFSIIDKIIFTNDLDYVPED